MEIQKAKVGDGIEAGNTRWSFGGATPLAFDDHVRKSVPMYAEGHDLILRLSDFFVREGGLGYDLGASTGVLIRDLAERHDGKGVRWIGIDVEEAMVDQAQVTMAGAPAGAEVRLDDLATIEFEPCDMIIAYYTIQFVHPALRQQVIDRIYQALNWGGAFILFEKVRGPDARFQDIASGIYSDFKLEQGFSEEEVIGKARSLRGVLEPFSEQGNFDLMQRAGFVDVMSVMKWVCWEGFLAIK